MLALRVRLVIKRFVVRRLSKVVRYQSCVCIVMQGHLTLFLNGDAGSFFSYYRLAYSNGTAVVSTTFLNTKEE